MYDEIEWWKVNFGTDKIILVLTDPDEAVEGLFSSQIEKLKLTEKPWIDLRGWQRRETENEKIRDSYEQLVQLASLLQSPPKTKGELWPSWKREFDRQKRRKLFMLVSLTVFFFLSIAGALGVRHWILRGRAIEVLGTFNATFLDQSTELWIHNPPTKPKHSWRQFGDSVRRLSLIHI